MWVISVSKTYKHRGKNINHRDNTNKYWQIMYYDYNEDGNLVLYSMFVNRFQAYYYKLNKFYKRKFICVECTNVFEALVKKKQKTAQCPSCEL